MAKLKPNANAYARISYARELLGDTKGAIAAMELAVDSSIGVARAVCLVADAARQPACRLAPGGRGGDPLPRGARVRARLSGCRLRGLAELRAAEGDLAGAAELYRQAAAAAPVPEFAASLGDTLATLGRTSEAERAWREADELERLFAANGGRNLLETAEFDLNHDRNFRRALDRARRGRAERPSVEGDHVLAWALYKNDRCAEARRRLAPLAPPRDARRRRPLPPQPDRGVPRKRQGRRGRTGPACSRSTRRISTLRRRRGGSRPRR